MRPVGSAPGPGRASVPGGRELHSISFVRRLPSERRMRPAGVVVVDPAADPDFGVAAGLECVEMDVLVFERAPP